MKRKLLFLERVLLGDGDKPFNVLFPVRLCGDFEESAVELVFEKLQKKHLWLNAFIKNDDHDHPWFSVDESNPVKIPIRVVPRDSAENWQTESVKEWSIPFDTKKGPLMRLVWIKDEGVSEMILVMHHCLSDGRSIVAVLDEFLQLLDNINANIACETSITGIEDIIPPALLQNKKLRIRSKLIMGAVWLALSLLPSKGKQVDRQKDYFIHWKLSKENTAGLITLCKTEGVTVNSMMCNIILSAFKQVKQKNALNKISCPVDIRNFIPRIKENNIFAFPLMILVSAYENLNFSANARAIQKDITRKISKLKPNNIMMILEAGHSSLNKLMNFLKNQKPTNDCMFSNLGKINIPRQYKSFEIETIFSPTVMAQHGSTTAITTLTYSGQIDFSIMSSEGYLPYDDALNIKHKMMQMITENIDTEKYSIA
jgi:NRPS condensation-like uncharacterized protein